MPSGVSTPARGWRSSRYLWTAVGGGLALFAAVAAAVDRPVIFDLTPPSYRESFEFTARAAEVEVDPRPPGIRFETRAPEIEVDPGSPRARIPRLLPGPAETWAGSVAHTLRFRLGRLPVRPLLLSLHAQDTHDGAPPRLTVAANDAAIATIQTRSGAGRSPYGHRGGLRSRYLIRIPPTALGDGSNVRLSITNESGAWVIWERIWLAQADPTLSPAHLARRGRLPSAGSAFLAASLGTLLLWHLGGAAGEPWSRRVRRATGPAAALILVGVAAGMPADSALLAVLPRWAWLALPWVLLARPRGPGRDAPPVATNPALGSPAGQPAPRRRRLLKTIASVVINCALCLLALALSLLVAELALRYALRDVKSAGDTRTFFHQPESLDDQTNSLGFREREFRLRKPRNVYRIAVLGDSLTFGPGVPVRERFSNRLEQYLTEHRRGDLTYEVLNFGRAGWDTVDEVEVLRTLVLRTDPDFVILQWYVNDFENGDHSGRPRAPLPLVPSETLRLRLLRSSALYSLLEPKWATLQETLGLSEPHPAYMYRRFGDPEGPDSTFAMERIREFIAECKKARTPVTIVLFPHVGPDLVNGRYVFNYLHNRVLAACRQEKITCVDLRSTFAPYTDYRQLWVTPLDPHPSPLAHRLAADRLIDAFGPLWLNARP